MHARAARAPRATAVAAAAVIVASLAGPVVARAQDVQPQTPETAVHEHVEVGAVALTPTRDATGTAWLPAATPMYGVHQPWRGWDLRLSGTAFASFVAEPRDRHRTGGDGSRQFNSSNWGMVMLRRGMGEGRVGVRAMVSAEPATIPGCGTLSLLAVGEVCAGDTIHDRQQPHDMLMELAVDYERPLRGGWRWQVYAGVAGEPALGPTGYLHRPSAAHNPIAPVAHHWADAMHATFGIVTAGVHNGRWKAEASLFNGREPDESRVDLDLGALDSVAARVSFLPTDRISLQVSAGRLKEPTAAFLGRPQDAMTRATASVTYHRPLGSGLWATTASYGVNRAREIIFGLPFDITSAAAMLESSVTVGERHTAFARIEGVGMPAHHLHAHEFGAAVFSTGKIEGGYVRHLTKRRGLVPGVGAAGALALVPRALAPYYSGRVSPTLTFFLIVRPAPHEM